MPSRLPYPVYDADHHFYESAESITKYLPKKYKKAIQYVQVNGRTKLAVGGLISDYIPDPTFNHVAPPGSMLDWYEGKNPKGLTQREFFGDPIHPPEAWRTVEERLKEIDQQGLDGHRASIATHPKYLVSSPKAGFFCVMAAARFLSDVPHRMAKRAAATTQNNPGQTGLYDRKLL